MRPTRTADDLIGRIVTVNERYLLPKAKHHQRRLDEKRCRVVDVKQNKQGEITHIYVVKSKATRYDSKTGRFKTTKWLKTKIRIPVEPCAPTIRRIRRAGNPTFQWEGVYGRAVTTKGGVQWEGCQCSLAWWLNNPALMPFNIAKRLDLGVVG